MKRPCSSISSDRNGGFTMTELLVVIAVIAVLGLLLVPALAATKNDGRVLRCMNNQKQLTAAWLLYTSDYADTFPSYTGWAGGIMDWTAAPANTDRTILEDPATSSIALYVKAADLFKCPADTYQSAANTGPRVRSVSLNGVLGGSPAVQGTYPDGRIYYGSGLTAAKATKMTQLVKPGPANVFVLTDEHPDSINDAVFFFDPGCLITSEYWRDMPGSFHERSDSLTFADGHFELHQWLDPHTCPPVTFNSGPTLPWKGTFLRNSPDYQWMDSKMPYR